MRSFLPVAALVAVACAHGDHSGSHEPAVPADADWMTKHMAGKSPLPPPRRPTSGPC